MYMIWIWSPEKQLTSKQVKGKNIHYDSQNLEIKSSKRHIRNIIIGTNRRKKSRTLLNGHNPNRDRTPHHWGALPHHPAYGSRTKAVRLVWIESVVGYPTDFIGFWAKSCYGNFGHCRIIPVKAIYLLTTTIYRGQSAPAPFRPSPGWDLSTFVKLVSTGYYAVCWLLPCGQGWLPGLQPFLPAHGRPPGVNTCLSVRECRIYGHTLQWIEDFILLCRLVPVCAPHIRFLCVIPYLRGTLPWRGGFLPKHRHRYPVALPLHPSPPSGWI